MDYNGTMYAYVHNLQGDITGILDSTGALVVTCGYDAWGKPVQTNGSMANTLGKINPFQYRGYIFDEESVSEKRHSPGDREQLGSILYLMETDYSEGVLLLKSISGY